MMPDTPLYCECGNRLGLRRSDGAFVSINRGRVVIIPHAWPSTPELGKNSYWPELTCEACGRQTTVDKLLDAKVG
ncbi:hypothetical protein LCGC14_0790010 [marine sediment metagenome]|uniref:Uncharacterized protein n=1 Tax=marine sediment metagenome TaxID=412755 RepID=A0A0F9SCX3_9ZZZZ